MQNYQDNNDNKVKGQQLNTHTKGLSDKSKCVRFGVSTTNNLSVNE